MLHVASSCVCGALPAPGQRCNMQAKRRGACSAPLEEMGHIDGWPAWHRLNTGITVCMHYTQRLELPPRIQHVHYHRVCDALPVPRQQRIAWCSLFPLQVARGHIDGCPGIAVRMH